MKKSQWNDEEIETLLRNFPKIRDKRDSQEIYQHIIKKESRKQRYWIPVLATMATIFLLGILAASMIDNRNEYVGFENKAIEQVKSDSDSGYRVLQNKKIESTEAPSDSIDMNEKGEQVDIANQEVTPISVYHIDSATQSLVIIPLFDKRNVNYFVPVTRLVDKFAKGQLGENTVQTLSELDVAALGLTELDLDGIKITEGENEKTINIDFPKDSSLLKNDLNVESLFITMLKYQNIDKITYSTEGMPGAEFSHRGYLTEDNIPHIEKKAYVAYQFDKKSPQFLVPTNVSYERIEEALEVTKTTQAGDGISSSVPKEFIWKQVFDEGEQLTVVLAEEAILQNTKSDMLALEAILLTAKDFGFETVEIQNSTIEHVGSFDLNEPIQVPLAPNRIK
ncbi:hypothetical protein [Peribacillus loiseleuriae]|uniref:Sigma-X negative effector n=1 Tax=Peribacillus loiseleuriae TaxID=1679170 RepID=A0A0K9GVH8_9BACI|nr:hypothetical protein [Peribacillus loiseleuriae]KMY50633.1 hypothetical protein AC625_14895 [Peribacillus loiseleuriae]